MGLANDRLYHRMQLLFDLIALSIAWLLAIEVRILLNPVMTRSFSHDGAALWAPPLPAILLLWMAAAWWLRVYRRPEPAGFWSALARAAESAVIAVVVTIIVTFFFRHFGGYTSRSFVLVFAPLSCASLMLTQHLALWATLRVERRWSPGPRVAVVGQGQELTRVLSRFPGRVLTRAIRGVILPGGSAIPAAPHPVRVLGTTGQLAELINREHLDRIIVLESLASEQDLETCREVSKRMGVSFSRAVGLAEPDQKVSFSMWCGMTFVDTMPVSFTRGQELAKRILDVVLASLTLIALAPLFAVIAVLVKLSSPGPVLYKSPRVGKGGRHFTFLKFRTMYVENSREAVAAANEKDGHLFKIQRDPRVTAVGRVLRRYSLDELPQIINVLRGEMSLVGPRPLPAQDLDPDGMSRKFAAWSEQRSRVPPGITGLWQIRGRSALAFEDMIRYDIEYIRNWSLAMDLRILLETPGFVISGVGAY